MFCAVQSLHEKQGGEAPVLNPAPGVLQAGTCWSCAWALQGHVAGTHSRSLVHRGLAFIRGCSRPHPPREDQLTRSASSPQHPFKAASQRPLRQRRQSTTPSSASSRPAALAALNLGHRAAMTAFPGEKGTEPC